MKTLKLNKLNNGQLSKEQMKSVVGGTEQHHCSCGCCYQGQGGSSANDNMNANVAAGLSTKCSFAFIEIWWES